MAFWGRTFVFDGIPCEAYDLMMYDVGDGGDEDAELASTATIDEETVGHRRKPYFYGVKYENKLTFEIVFGVNQRRLDAGKYLDRYEIDAIAGWLTGHDGYKWLEIEQPDARLIRYNCMITGLSLIQYGKVQWALRAEVTCDGPYAYKHPEETSYTVNGETNVTFYNESKINGYYMPDIEITQTGGTFKIENMTDGGRTFALTNYPAAVHTVYVDNDHGIITNDQSLNLYPYFNFNFFRLKKGYNQLKITGNGTLKIRCSFPVDAGG